MTHGHFLDRCECGLIVSNCRCMGPKTERIVSPCRHKPQTQTVVAVASPKHERPQAESDAVKANHFGGDA